MSELGGDPVFLVGKPPGIPTGTCSDRTGAHEGHCHHRREILRSLSDRDLPWWRRVLKAL